MHPEGNGPLFLGIFHFVLVVVSFIEQAPVV